jgi:hypothetical protein
VTRLVREAAEDEVRLRSMDARREALEEAAGVAKTAWLTCPYGEIADAATMQAVCEHAEAAIRTLMEEKDA